MFGFIKVFVVLLSVYTTGSFGKSFCRSAPVINSDETLSYPFTIIVNKSRKLCHYWWSICLKLCSR